MNSYIITDDSIALTIGMTPHNISLSHPNYDRIFDALRHDDWDSIPDLLDIAKSVTTFCGDKISVDAENALVSYAGEVLHGSLTDRILRMMSDGFSIAPLTLFLDNLMLNPSKRAVDELYGFLEYGTMPITEDGHFLAYKRVNNDYTSVHDSKTDNSIGATPELPRNRVDDNKDQTCSSGLHFCSHGYLKSFCGERVVVLKVNPRDVVSIPTDYNNTKGRACRYEVVGELSPEEVTKALSDGVWGSSVIADYDDRDIIDEEEGEEVSQSYLDGYDRGRRSSEPKALSDGVWGSTEYVEDAADFVEAYTRGWKDGKGNKSRPNFSIVEEASLFDGTNEDNEEQEISDPSDNVATLQFSNGYGDGYRDGHIKYSISLRNKDDIDRCGLYSDGGQYAAGYVEGFKDGRGHKRKATLVVL